MGLGNIAGVAVAIALGGPGAVLALVRGILWNEYEVSHPAPSLKCIESFIKTEKCLVGLWYTLSTLSKTNTQDLRGSVVVLV